AREPILINGERPEDLAPGSARYRAVRAALEEIAAGRQTPSPQWRRDYSLVLGLERLLADERPRLADGAELSEHQVDALSGTLAALISELEEGRSAPSGNGSGPQAPVPAALEEPSANGEGDDEALAADEEPRDWDEEAPDAEEVIEDAPEDPGASRRFWFEHATGAGKTVAAVGFIEASRTGGVLILTHRRNLVDQFIGEISDRGYGDRLSPPLLGSADHPYGPVTVETYQWFVRNASQISDAYAIVICDEAHTALGEKT